MYENEKLDILMALRNGLSHHFNILEDHKFYIYGFDIVAKAILENYRTIFGAIKFDRFYSFEFALVKFLGRYNLAEIEKYIELVKDKYFELFTPSSDVMGTMITFIFIAPGIDKRGISFLDRFRYQKSFLLGLKGKYEMRIIFFDRKNKIIYTNKNAKVLKNYYEKLLKERR